jgi:hypothetical protein
MKFEISMPSIESILERGINVPISPKGHSWNQGVLGEKSRSKGVYIIHQHKNIQYVGKTSGDKMSFGMRLRRHFQEVAAGKHTYPRLLALSETGPIQVSLFDIGEILELIRTESKKSILWTKDYISLFEAGLIITLEPKFQTIDEPLDDVASEKR